MPSLPTLFAGRSPLLTTTFQACIINVIANILAQVIEYQKVQKALKARDPLEVLALDVVVAPFRVDLWRVLQFVVWTCMSVPPNFRWQQWLERRFPAYYADSAGEKELPVLEIGGEGPVRAKKRNFKHVMLKILCDQGCAAPINCSSFLVVMTLLKGGSFADAILMLRNKFWQLKFAGWRLWPMVGLINFTFVPVDRRVIVSTVVGLCWNVFLVLFMS